MQIEYHKQQETFTIKDGLRSQYLMIKIMMVFLLVNSIVIVVTASRTGFETLDYLWVLFGFIALYSLYNLIFKKTAIGKIAVKDIAHLKVQNLRNKSHFSLVLKNGKVRNLAVFSDDKEEQRLIQLFNKAKVPKA
jgi:hypothetical protein